MSKRLRWRVLLIVLVVAGLVAGYVWTGYSHAKKEWVGPGSPPLSDALKKGIKLGLDLRGGIHLVLQVNTADAVKAERDDAVELLQNQAREQGLVLGAVETPSEASFTVAVTPQTDEKKLDEVVQALARRLECRRPPEASGLRPEGRRAAARRRTMRWRRRSRRSATAWTSSAWPSLSSPARDTTASSSSCRASTIRGGSRT